MERRPISRSGMGIVPRVRTSLCLREVCILPSFIDWRFFALSKLPFSWTPTHLLLPQLQENPKHIAKISLISASVSLLTDHQTTPA